MEFLVMDTKLKIMITRRVPFEVQEEADRILSGATDLAFAIRYVNENEMQIDLYLKRGIRLYRPVAEAFDGKTYTSEQECRVRIIGFFDDDRNLARLIRELAEKGKS